MKSHLWLLTLLIGWLAVQTPLMAQTEIVILRDQQKLLVKKNNQVIRSYHVALGSGVGEDKLMEGDRRTPSGHYRIIEARDSDHFHRFIQLDYPSVDDAKRALKAGRISRLEYREILEAHIYNRQPPQDTALGGAIGIHGIGVETDEKIRIHGLANWTKGCIAMRNHEIDELMAYISEKTPVMITSGH